MARQATAYLRKSEILTTYARTATHDALPSNFRQGDDLYAALESVALARWCISASGAGHAIQAAVVIASAGLITARLLASGNGKPQRIGDFLAGLNPVHAAVFNRQINRSIN